MANSHKSMRVPRNSAASFNTSAKLIVKVGSTANRQSLTVHESFLTARSEFFRRAMNGNWREPGTQIINLLDDEPEIFALYLNFVYKNGLPTIALLEEEFRTLSLREVLHRFHKEHETMFKLYILAEKFQDGMANDEAITAIFQLSHIHDSDQ
ncbi:uncharacterized protein EKO05_0009545 [Ascochyta rabiei]|uniref:Uncharacterized protein n=1 Tax=Didymella rabiei TaxID=5454 RepID=A0A163CMX3_DIDRA|nr:uncharacterized protein EKO05_0009545 [Ascochyta rabiei]KZM22577.1 hypothetical protein ST47_g6323 [Ascochyta rabiei]UPX19277.1 hypothetical protein EKO05_0009545 [Ascochyta rabiei]